MYLDFSRIDFSALRKSPIVQTLLQHPRRAAVSAAGICALGLLAKAYFSPTRGMQGAADLLRGARSAVGSLFSRVTDVGAPQFEGEVEQDHLKRGKAAVEPLKAQHDGIDEQISNLDASLAASYLFQRGHGKYARSVNEFEAGGMRPSALRTENLYQGMIVNGRRHQIGTYEEYRSGAFTVHDKEIDDADLRKDLCVAQALPKLVAAIESMAKDKKSLEAARKTDRFLYVEQSLLSHYHGKERRMLEDTRNAIQHLNDKLLVTVKKGKGDSSLAVNGERIMLTVYSEHVQEERCHTVCAGLCSMGLNEQQSVGQALTFYDPLQDEINQEFYQRLNQAKYAIEDLRSGRQKDLDETLRIRKRVAELGGRHGVDCKSGKDRTSCWVAKSASQQLATIDKCEQLRIDILKGPSYILTHQNTGKAPAYAFNAFQRGCFPAGFTPPPALCGKVPS